MLALSAQGLAGPRQRGGPAEVLGRLRAVELDTISVLARSHELVTFARLGPVPRSVVDRGYWGPESETFEYWSHAACILPLEDWPLYGFRRKALASERGHRWHRLEDVGKSCAFVRDRIRGRGASRPESWAGRRKAAPGGTGRRPRSWPSGCSTQASSSADNARDFSVSTTSPSGRSPPRFAPPSPRTRSASSVSCAAPLKRWVLRQKPTSPPTMG